MKTSHAFIGSLALQGNKKASDQAINKSEEPVLCSEQPNNLEKCNETGRFTISDFKTNKTTIIKTVW